ncbi:HD domain-containing phosphohydrolase [Sulfuricurvum sp.]|uniref:HD-GYP domain-containing protein n=1 Tax=Sulfuricurvum sp. TaxID=2025608 RepID=UPI00262243A7|nr:HD domain-containing phosphohydrolase [Sulfuricurvum sp.]MDD2267701.1 HD domain-containing protein [Sulfuricurvum sp.]MDD2949171.1 HD domain-containing protein [Sulfuricurvum sp.]
MIKNIYPGPLQKKLLQRLLIFTFVMAFLSAITTLLIELGYVQERVEKRALDTMKTTLFSFNFSSVQNNTFDIEKSKLFSLTFFDQNGSVIYHRSKQGSEPILLDLKQNEKLFSDHEPDNETAIYSRSKLNDHIFVTLIIPVFDNDIISWIEVYYDATQNGDIADVYKDITFNILLTLSIVFLVAVFIYPTILFLERNLIARTRELYRANLDLLGVMGTAIAKRDNETNAHNYRVTLYTIAFAKAIKVNNERMRSLIKGAFLHDIGKIGVSDAILLKNGTLSEDEYDAMKKHVDYGVEIVQNASWLNDSIDIIAFHHEHYDGNGYQKKMQGKSIPKNAQLFSIVDVFDALTSRRPYKKEYSYETAKRMMLSESGTHFNPEMLSIFFTIIRPLYNQIGAIEDEVLLKKLLGEETAYYFME